MNTTARFARYYRHGLKWRQRKSYSNGPLEQTQGRWLQPYIKALQRLSARTGTPLPSLIVSFAVLHELTAILPVVGFFFGAKYFGLGESMVDSIRGTGNNASSAAGDPEQSSWIRTVMSGYIDDGEKWAGRVGRRYGWWGYEKGASPESVDRTQLERHLAGDVANAVLAYAVIKALLPVRVGLSLYLAPAFSRSFVNPITRLISRSRSLHPPKP